MPDDPSIDVRFTDEGSTLLVRVTGELDLATSPQLIEEMSGVDWGEKKRVIFNLLEVDFMDSSGLGALVALRNDHPDTDISIVTGGEGLVAKVLRLTAMEKLFSVYPSMEAALS